MQVIRIIGEGEYKLQHSRYVDSSGVLRDGFDLIRTFRGGDQVHFPILPPFKSSNRLAQDNILDATNYYTSEDYKNILNEAIAESKKHD